MALPTLQEVINKYLYDSTATPASFTDGNLVRDPGSSSAISINVEEYMSTGAGRFALASNFVLIQQFFEAPYVVREELFDLHAQSNDANVVSLSKQDMLNYYSLDSIGLSVDQKDWDDGSGDYAERTYIWGNTSFQINNDVEFVIEKSINSSGIEVYTVRLENFYIEPRRLNQGQGAYRSEDFDFNSGDGSTTATQETSERAVDPSGIGRVVSLDFTQGSLTPSTYTFDDFVADEQKTDQYYSRFETDLSKQSALDTGVQNIFDTLFDDGVTATLYQNKLVTYGTIEDDLMNSHTTSLGYDVTDETSTVSVFGGLLNWEFDLPQHEHTDTGFVFVGGAGNDTLIGGEKKDHLFGGDDVDKLSGGTGEDELFGEDGNDILEGGVRSDLMPDDVTTFFDSLSTTLYYDDEEADILDGGDGYDKYYVYHVEKYITDSTNWDDVNSSADPYGFFDAVFIGHDYGGVVQQKFDVADFSHIDRIRDSDGDGDIFVQTPDSPSGLSTPPFNQPTTEYWRWSYQGVDLYSSFSSDDLRAYYFHEGDLYGFTIWARAEFGSGINADWFGLKANFVIEDFQNGQFGIDLPLGQRGSDSDDTPNLSPAGNGEGAHYSGEGGADDILGTAYDDVLRGDSGNDELDGGQGDDDIAGGTGDDDLSGGDGNDQVAGGEGDDTVSGGAGNDQVFGGSGNDTISGGSGNDALNGHAGVDLLIGGGGDDNYYFTNGYGNDTIRENGANSDVDTINLSRLSVSDIALQMTGANNKDLLVTILSTGETILVEDQFLAGGNSDTSIEKIIVTGTHANDYQDGDTWTESQILDLALAGTPTNNAPVVSGAVADQNSAEDLAWSYAVPSDVFSDPDGDALSYTATLADGSDLPAWLTFDANSRTFSGTPPQDFNGTVSLKVIASDGADSAEDVFDLVINPVNDAPIIANVVSDQSSAEDAAWSYTVPANTFSDIDGDALTYTATLADGSALPAWLTFDANTRTFSGTPPQDFNGTLSLKVVASDGTDSAEDQFDLVIDPVNDAPIVANAAADQAASVDAAWNFSVPADAFSDVDGDALTYSASLADGSALPVWLSFDAATQTFSGTPPQGSSGTLSLKVVASDGSAAVEDVFDLDIEAAPITPTSGDDTLSGTSGSDTIDGLGGNDTIDGKAGDDVLTGGVGGDTLTGGSNFVDGDASNFAAAPGGFSLPAQVAASADDIKFNSIEKRDTASGSWNSFNAGVYSQESFTGAGSMSTVVAHTNRYVAVGLSADPTDTGRDSMDFAFYLGADGYLQIFESGQHVTTLDQYYVDDVLTVERLDDGTIQYLRNGNVIHTSANTSSTDTALSVDGAFFTNGARLENTSLTVGSNAPELVTWETTGPVAKIAEADNLTSTVVDLNNDGVDDIAHVSDQGEIWAQLGLAGGGHGEAIYVEQAVAYGSVSTNNAIEKVSGGDDWGDGVAASQTGFTGAGSMETVVAQVSTSISIGLSVEGSQSDSTIDFAFVAPHDSQLQIWEGGQFVTHVGTYVTGDTLSVERLADGTIQYLRNGSVVHTSQNSVDVNTALYAHTSIKEVGGRISDTTLASGGNAPELVDWTSNSNLRDVIHGDDMSIGFADADGDGKTDVVLTDADGNVWSRTALEDQDTFVFNSVGDSSGSGTDVITDFNLGKDKIDISALGLSFDDLNIYSYGGDTYIEVDNSPFNMKLENFTDKLQADEFIF